MALQKQLVHLNLTGGLQKKDDEFLVIPSKLTAATDAEFDDASTVRSRDGIASLTLPGGYATAIRAFARAGVPNVEFENGATIRATGLAGASDYGNWRGSALSYEPARFMRVGVTTKRIMGQQDLAQTPSFDVAYGTTNYCIAWVNYDDVSLLTSVHVSIRSVSTGIEVQRNVISGAASSEVALLPRVIYDSTNLRFAIFTYHEDTAFVTASTKGSYVAEAGGSFTGPTSLIGMNYAAGTLAGMMDAAIYQGQGYALVARDADAVGAIRMRLVDLALGSIVAATNGVPAAAAASLTAHATFSAGVLTGHALYGAGANLRGYRLPSNTGIQSAEATIRTLTGVIGRVAVVDVGGALHIVIDQTSATSNTFATTYLINATTAHAFTSQTAVRTNCFIGGRVFSMRSRNLIPVVFTSNSNQSTHLVLDITEAAENLGVATTAEPLFVSRLEYGEVAWSSLASTEGTASRVVGCHASMVPFLKYETDLRLAGTTNATSTCVVAATFDPTGQLADAEVNGLSVLAGALPLVCDGFQIVEEGFHWGPEVQGAALSPVATGTGIFSFPSVGNYFVAFTEGWQDTQGNWHESAVSRQMSLTTTGGNLDINPTFIRPPSLKNNRILIMYRTRVLGTDTSLYLAHAGDLSSGTVIEVNDTDLDDGEQLYTAGNVLPNTPAPACRHVEFFDRRLVLSGCGDGQRVYWSKQVTPGYGVEFSSGDPTHQQQVPTHAGRVVGTAEMDGRLIVVCESAVGVIGGQGPSSTGLAGQYSDFATIITETGALWSSPKSILRSAEGVWFRSTQGIRLISRSGSLAVEQDGKQFGSDVDSLVSGSVIAVAGIAKQQVRFYTQGDVALVYDTQWRQWTRFTRHKNVDACFAGGVFYHLSNYSTSTPLLRYTSSAAYKDFFDDAGNQDLSIVASITTPWLSFAGLQGFERLYRLMILGKGDDAGTTWAVSLSAKCNYDTATAGDTASVGVSPNGVVQLQHHFAKQKVESMQLTISWQAETPDDSTGRLRITDLTLQVGVKNGYFKMPSSQRF